jgi:predicted NACHT family NTPase
MVGRSLKASLEGIEQAKVALTDKGWSQEELAGRVGRERQTAIKFFSGKPIDRKIFVQMCQELELDWKVIADLPVVFNPYVPPEFSAHDIDELVQTLRHQVAPIIRERCGTMRVLDMSQPIELGSIYTSVNILERITGRRGLDLAELVRDVSPEALDPTLFNPEKFERFCLGDIRERRIPGLEAVQQFSKLMILGKPGAGKTTFLKHLAIQCMGGIFLGAKQAVVGATIGVNYSEKELLFKPPTLTSTASLLQGILEAGKGLILLDGLDEVREADNSSVLRQIRDFSQQFSQNQFLITCRIAAREYTFEQFTEVEIADFDDRQIADFSNKWFHSKNDPVKADRFLERLRADPPILELATSPLLLTLLCLVFEDSGDFPANRSELYKDGVDVLLKKWDAKRNIERDQVYKRLSLRRKEDLLSQVAYITFQAGNYFFKQKEAERHINQYIQNLPSASADPETLELDSAAVLKSIEAQHGLFVERARGIYSFSHLTFHEYFTARKIANSCNPYTMTDPELQGLAQHLTERRWREVILLTVGMLEDAGALLQLLKQQTDVLMSGDEQLQHFLVWVAEKSSSVNVPYKPAAVRAFYLDRARALEIDHTHDLPFRRHLAPILDRALARAIDRALALDLALDRALDRARDLALDLALALARAIDRALALDRVLDRALDRALTRALALALDLDRALALALDQALQRKLQALKDQLPNRENRENFEQWWEANGQAWAEQLRAVMIEHRNIGHDWQFSLEQTELLKQYYDANLLLANCLNRECYISREVRQEIEATLLLPIRAIEGKPLDIIKNQI